MDVYLYVVVAVLGCLVGSFLNVCIFRLPRGESIVWPGSHCPACGTPIRSYDNIPVLSYLYLGGRCRACHGEIPPRYPLVEAANAIGYVGILWFFGPGWPAVLYGILFSALLVVVGTDLSHQIIPDAITLPGVVVGLLGAVTVLPVGWVNALLGIIIGGGILWVLAWISPYLFGKEGMGGGDIKLLAMIGAFLGWKPALLTIMIGSLTGSLIGLSLISFHLIKRDEYIPFGPFLAFGALVAMFFAQPILDWYQGLLGPS
ncbi:Type 4 prepilin-like proteins leader peptide-processing enzyme [Nitrospira japonica]|uniref:Prepilin leader peptidase/N-methyltransferase n=1 Tax=Nitrospira japonica TaxID=1325564 RepID=A0A1W1I1M6_9BACT|nr:A24 family peptidase [Nitrospira japonica]SLM46910.1 Type 4 prepilin-like proteins leader peptide-processing enzyme [Nitrospira japonica]